MVHSSKLLFIEIALLQSVESAAAAASDEMTSMLNGWFKLKNYWLPYHKFFKVYTYTLALHSRSYNYYLSCNFHGLFVVYRFLFC